MNKKNKNKNRSKPTNPIPSTQKLSETALVTEETILVTAEEKPLSSVKESESVIENKGEQIEPTLEENDVATDTPKKPKRNKGKKKKHEELALEEVESVLVEDSAPVPPQILDSEVKVKDESAAETTETKFEEENKKIEENITASVRKKKNKKKTNEQCKVEETSQQTVCVEKKEEKVKAEDHKTELIIQPDQNTTPDLIEPDLKQTKKKNKKKKHRHDSEKSDKADEVVICTAAFQELVSSTGNENDIKSEQNLGTSEISAEGGKSLATSIKEETLKNLIESVLLPEESKQSDDEALQHDRLEELKSKKKSKKDKKQQPKQGDEKNKLPQEQTIQQRPLSTSRDNTQELPSIEQVQCKLQDTVPKPKAKIAKPVEKKRKGKTESSESHENKTEDDNFSVGLDIKETSLVTEKLTENISIDVASPSVSVQNIDETTETQQMFENEATVMISDKPSETLTPTDVINPPIEAPIASNILDLADVNIDIKPNEATIESSVMPPDTVIFKSDKELENKSSKPLFPLDVSEETDKGITIISEPYKTVEKRKKKHPKKVDVPGEKTSGNKALVSLEPEPEIEETQQKQKDEIISHVGVVGVDTPGDVEISSLITDDIDVSSDATPDFIHHPLAASQQFPDSNNNMIIREITTTEDKPSLPLLIPTEPIIQDSGETPEPVGDKMSPESPSLLVIRERSLTNEPEKTDLKSKMMEVSQDMEELRLSIERSLAELTSMEKTEEQNIDKRLEETLKLDTVKVNTSKSEEPIPCGVKDCISGDSASLGEIILSELIKQETHSKSQIFTETVQPTPENLETLQKHESIQEKNIEMPAPELETQPQAPARKDHKGKGKGKRKGKPEAQSQQTTSVTETATVGGSENSNTEVKKEEKEKSEQKSQSSESNQNKGKQQAMQLENGCDGSEEISTDPTSNIVDLSFEPIDNFEDALTSSVDDVNKTFEMIASEVNNTPEFTLQNPEINIIAPAEDTDTAEPKQNPVSPPKNLLGHPDIPVQSNRTDYKKEKNKPPNMRQAKVKIKDAVDIERTEKSKQSKESQTDNKRKATNNKNVLESFSYMTNGNAEYVYKYSFRKVFLQSLCHVCRKELSQRVPCQFCSLVFYCSQKHKDEDWPQHQSLCFAICTIVHLKELKHIYADAKNITGQNYRLLRMQMIISCEKVLKRKLVPWEQEALLYPRICADAACREWRQSKLADCEGCGQISYCSEHPDHLPASHQRWCRSYALYQRLVHHQQTQGRLEPKLPARLVPEGYRIPDKINEVLAAMYDEKIDMTDMEYAALAQLATAPLTAAYCHQLHLNTATYTNGISKKSTFVVHMVGAELQFEADVLFKWELFFLHLKPAVKELRVVLISPDLNPSNLPLDLLGKVNLCESCKAEKRRVLFSFQDKRSYYEYWSSDEFYSPDIVCALNPSIQRSSMYNGKDTWPTAVNCILKLKTPFVISSYSINELNRDVARIKECTELSGVGFKTISEPKCNPFASVRPDRNFITDDETPLLFKNYCFSVLCGV